MRPIYNLLKAYFYEFIAEDSYKDGFEAGKACAEREQAYTIYCEQNWLVNPHEILKEALTKEELKQLREEALYLETTRLWTIMQNVVRQQAIEQALIKSTSFDHVLPGKMMLHNLNILQEIVTKFKQCKN